MSTDKKNANLAFELASMLRGSMPVGDMAYVCAEIAFVLSKLDGRFVSRELDFVDFLNTIDCSVELRADLMSDVVPLWGQVSRLQGRFDTAACQEAIREYAQHSDLDNVNVPASLIPLIAKLISAEPDGVMADIACGRGLVLERSLMEDTGLIGEAVDINSRNVHFAEMLLAPIKPRGAVYCKSAFDFMVDHMWKYDKVFCYPPMGMRIDRNMRWEEFQNMLPGAFPNVGVGCRSELLFALTTVAAMKEMGRAVMLLPEGALFNQMSGAVAAREYLVNSGYLDCVISLPERLLERAQIGMSLLIFSRQEDRKFVTMIDASNLAERGRRFNTLSEDTSEKIINAVYGFHNEESWTRAHCKVVSCDEIRESGYNVSARHYFEKAAVPTYDNSVRFGDIVLNVDRGANIASKDMDDLVAPGEGVCYYLTPSQIDNGIIAEDIPEMRELPRKTPTLEEGDLILMRTGATSKIAIYENTFDKPVVLSSNLFVCRLKKDIVDPWYLKAFLESEGGKALIASIAIGAVIKSISLKSLEDMQIPLPDMARQREIGAAFKARFDRLRDLKKEISSVGREMSEIFDKAK
jgi:type I restriction enzyme M protein